MRTAKFIDIIKSFGGYLRIDNLAGYKDEYVLDDLGDRDLITKKIFQDNAPLITIQAIIKNIPAGSETPIIIDFAASTIKIGSASAVPMEDLSLYRSNPDGIKFEIIDSEDELQTTPKDPGAWLKKTYTDNTYTELSLATITPDTDTGMEGGVTLDNINIIIKA